MTVTESIHAVARWLEEEVCPHVSLKVPSNRRQTDDYPYELAHPTVYKMFAAPASLASGDSAPSILVHLLDGDDHPRRQGRDLKFRLILSVWNPGLHPEDIVAPAGGEGAAEADRAKFVPNADGWNDVWNLMDLLLQKLWNVEQIGGIMRLKPEDGFKYGPYKEDGNILDFYPYYFATLEFGAAMAQAPPTKYVNDFL